MSICRRLPMSGNTLGPGSSSSVRSDIAVPSFRVPCERHRKERCPSGRCVVLSASLIAGLHAIDRLLSPLSSHASRYQHAARTPIRGSVLDDDVLALHVPELLEPPGGSHREVLAFRETRSLRRFIPVALSVA